MRGGQASLSKGVVTAVLAGLLSAGGTLPIWMATLLPEPGHVCACSLDEGHHCRCPKCSREAHEEFIEALADGRPRLLAHDCEDEHGAARLARLPRAVLSEPEQTVVRPGVATPRPQFPPDPPWTRLLEPPPHPPPIV